ncbi:MAG: hypothetical protein AB7D37_20080 [Desulfovibrio sp.]
MRRLLPSILGVPALVFLLAAAASAQGFGPKNYAECFMINAKRAASQDGGMLMRRACKCRFQNPKEPGCEKYSQAALDCMLANLVPADTNDKAWGVERACRTKNPVQ